MKKILFLLVMAIMAVTVSACTRQDGYSAEQTGDQINNSSDNPQDNSGTNIPASSTSTPDNNNNANNLATASSSAAPALNSSAANSSSSKEAAQPAQNNNMINPEQFTDLTKEYSQAIIKTSLGNIQVKFYASDSPFTVNNFLNLAKLGFYNGTKFHRVIKDFMIQGGDPLSKESDSSLWGTGGPGYRFKDEFNNHPLVAGSLAMANAGPNTNGSQFFIVTASATPWLDGHHTNFGEVVSGMDIVKKIEGVETVDPANHIDRPVKDITINSIELVK